MSSEHSGTMPVSAQHSLALEALQSWMRARIEGIEHPLTAVQFRGGQSNPTYLVTDRARRSWVVRTKPAAAAKLLPSAHAIEREYRIMGALARVGQPVPRVLGLCEDEGVIGRAFFVMEYVEGRVLWDPALPECGTLERTRIYDAMNRVLASLHGVDYAGCGLSDFGRTGNYLARQVSRWTRQYEASATVAIPAMDRLIEWLPDHLPARDETAVVHGDYRIDNLVFHPREPRILAVLDWELSTLGDPIADLAYHCLAWRIAPDQFRGMAGADFAVLGIPHERDYLAQYCERTGRTGIPDWNFYLAYNLFRLAAILQGIMKRHVQGLAASAHAHDAGRRAGILAELGWRLAQGAEAPVR